MSLTVKAFLHERTWRGDPIEIRRFTVDQDVSSSYAYLVEKLVQVFPSLTPANFVLAWTDADGDIITISSDQELVEALDQFEGSIFRLLLKKRPSVECPSTSCKAEGTKDTPPADPNASQQEEPSQGSFHPGVQCDGCNGPIYGTRFKCLVCRDYDLCSGCEGKGIHVDHNMQSISDPWSYHPWGRFQHCPRGRFGPHPGPFRGRGGCCRGGRGGGGGGPAGGQPFAGGFFAPWWQGAGFQGNPWFNNQGEKQQEKDKTAEDKTAEGKAAEEPMDTEQRPGANEEDRKTFLRGVGEAVSNFLEPFGVKVDVDVLGGGEAKPASDTTASTADAPVSDEVIEEALAQLRSMGYQDKGGWLKELVSAKGGDVAKVLDALHPVVDQTD